MCHVCFAARIGRSNGRSSSDFIEYGRDCIEQSTDCHRSASNGGGIAVAMGTAARVLRSPLLLWSYY